MLCRLDTNYIIPTAECRFNTDLKNMVKFKIIIWCPITESFYFVNIKHFNFEQTITMVIVVNSSYVLR